MNRKAFFAAVRNNPFGGSLSQGQVDGMNAVLDYWDDAGLTDIRRLAYALATQFHETARTMQPVIETRQPSEKENPSVDEAIRRLEKAWAAGKLSWVSKPYWRKDTDGLSWLGRGLPQLTHKANYERAERETGIPFTSNPELMLEMAPAVTVMMRGMAEGWFTGKKLSDYFKEAELPDWINARRIINGLDKAELIAGYAKAFHKALEASQDGEEPEPVVDSLESVAAAVRALEARVDALEDLAMDVPF